MVTIYTNATTLPKTATGTAPVLGYRLLGFYLNLYANTQYRSALAP